MSNFKNIFRNRHTILPVIRLESLEQAHRNTCLAKNAGCDGVFLINHSMSHRELLRIHHALSDRFPDWWVGVNCLGVDTADVFADLTSVISGVWADNAKIDERQESQPEADAVAAARRDSGWGGSTSVVWPSSTSVKSMNSKRQHESQQSPWML